MKSELLVRGAVSGAIAGLGASFVMTAFQAALSKSSKALFDSGESNGDDEKEGASEPATVKAAAKISRAVAGEEPPEEWRAPAGSLVHYGFGAALGLAYGLAATAVPQIRAGYGTAYGAGVALVADEILAPAAGLSGPPTETPPSTHLYSLVSHLVFGAALEAFRRIADEALLPFGEEAFQPKPA